MKTLRAILSAAALAVALAACSFGAPTTPVADKPAATARDAAKPPSKTPASAPAPAPSGGDGKYYLDDGPPSESDRLALLNTPDAVVKREPINPAHNRPYTVFGKTYTPRRTLAPYRERGVASWYGKRYHGRQTSVGEIYDMYKMTAAHPTLPIPSYVRVTRVSTGAQVVVRVNDRGPFLNNRIIDLSYAAATRLDIVDSGVGEVIVEAILPDANTPAAPAAPAPTPSPSPTSGTGAYYVQVGAFSGAGNADAMRRDLRQRLPSVYRIHRQAGDSLFRVQIGPYDSYARAAQVAQELCAGYEVCGFVKERRR